MQRITVNVVVHILSIIDRDMKEVRDIKSTWLNYNNSLKKIIIIF